ncbi:MAG TPA: D-alanine--D-alanine ligase A [Elusimicrobia bacterium]|nr:D-alanine--D-alanine ligase A [Elusimicrobiota bacterium]HBT60251.1 D-alanine--D-alanine ligase A [Elusimicrobiota bacterium]
MNKLKVLVLCGGQSAEHEVSLVSARTVLANLDAKRYAAQLVYIDRRGRWRKAQSKLLTQRVGDSAKALLSGSTPAAPQQLLASAGAVFPVLHGPLGEDGTMQGLLEVAGVPYVGCGVLGSALGMDKEIAKRLCLQAGLPILPYAVVRHPEHARALAGRLGLPIFVKPARMGSSVGVTKVAQARELPGAIREAFRYDDKVVLERGIPAREIECALLGDPWSRPPDPLELKASICGEIVPQAAFYTYRAKYLDPDGAKLQIPADIPTRTMARVRELAMRAFRVLDGYGMARADFLMDRGTGKIWFNEVNTIPGFTAVSMYPMLWKASGVSTPELIYGLIELALRRHRVKAGLNISPDA